MELSVRLEYVFNGIGHVGNRTARMDGLQISNPSADMMFGTMCLDYSGMLYARFMQLDKVSIRGTQDTSQVSGAIQMFKVAVPNWTSYRVNANPLQLFNNPRGQVFIEVEADLVGCHSALQPASRESLYPV